VSSRRTPVQRRSRERVEQILTAASELLSEGGVEALTTRSLARHAGIPVGTIYRYFANRDAIIDAYLDRDLALIERSIVEELLATRQVTFQSMTRAFAEGHWRYHRAHPESVLIWFGGRVNPAVARHVQALDARLARSLGAASTNTGMVDGAPVFLPELLVRMFDRLFEYLHSRPRSVEEQERILTAGVDVVAGYLERFATPASRSGVPAEDFVAHFDGSARRVPGAAPR
jgi:AcrR family transcriptional regulator